MIAAKYRGPMQSFQWGMCAMRAAMQTSDANSSAMPLVSHSLCVPAATASEATESQA